MEGAYRFGTGPILDETTIWWTNRGRSSSACALQRKPLHILVDLISHKFRRGGRPSRGASAVCKMALGKRFTIRRDVREAAIDCHYVWPSIAIALYCDHKGTRTEHRMTVRLSVRSRHANDRSSARPTDGFWPTGARCGQLKPFVERVSRHRSAQPSAPNSSSGLTIFRTSATPTTLEPSATSTRRPSQNVCGYASGDKSQTSASPCCPVQTAVAPTNS